MTENKREEKVSNFGKFRRYPVEYAVIDGTRSLGLDIREPLTGNGVSAPVIIWVHGGGWQGCVHDGENMILERCAAK